MLTLEETARLTGRYRWLEMRLFETMGRWIPSVPEPEVAVLLGTQCHHHAWHAELWYARLPELRELDPEELTAPAGEGVAALLTAAAEPAATIPRLVGLYRVLIPRTIAAYASHLDRASPVSDGPVIRALKLALADEQEDWRAGEALLQSLITTAGAAREAAAHLGRLEELAVVAGGLV